VSLKAGGACWGTAVCGVLIFLSSMSGHVYVEVRILGKTERNLVGFPFVQSVHASPFPEEGAAPWSESTPGFSRGEYAERSVSYGFYDPSGGRTASLFGAQAHPISEQDKCLSFLIKYNTHKKRTI
jgi:hypothetical protein